MQRQLCIDDRPDLRWLAEEMLATPLPAGVHLYDSRRHGAVDALMPSGPSRDGANPFLPVSAPMLYVRCCEPGAQRPFELQLQHPYQEAFDHAVALALLLTRSELPGRLLVATEEAWRQRYEAAMEEWQPRCAGGAAVGGTAPGNCGGGGSVLFEHVDTGMRRQADPREHLLREQQIGEYLIRKLRKRFVPVVGESIQPAAV